MERSRGEQFSGVVDDRYIYDLALDETAELPPIAELDLAAQGPRCLANGDEVTIVAAGYSTHLAMQAREQLQAAGMSAEVVDLRVLNPFDPTVVIQSVRKTRRLLVVDGGWRNSGFTAEVIASVTERLEPGVLLDAPRRITLPGAPAPASRVLEQIYYPTVEDVALAASELALAAPREATV